MGDVDYGSPRATCLASIGMTFAVLPHTPAILIQNSTLKVVDITATRSVSSVHGLEAAVLHHDHARMMTVPTTASRLVPAALLLLLGGLAGCGGEDDPAPASDPTSSSAAGFPVQDGIAPDDLLDCLEEAGLPVTAKDATPMGVEVPVEGLEVGPLEGESSGDSAQGADLWVFQSGTVASENRVNITLSDEDTPSSWVAGNVVVRLFYASTDGDPQIESLRSCLPY